MKTIVMIIAILFVTAGIAQEKKPEIVIQTSGECGMCKDRIEEKLNYTKGIIFSELDVESKKLTVKYVAKTITADEIRQIISELGYDADDVKANPAEVKKLPACCQPGGMSKEKH